MEKTCDNCFYGHLPIFDGVKTCRDIVGLCLAFYQFKPKEIGIKHDDGKPPVYLLFEYFPNALKEVAKVC